MQREDRAAGKNRRARDTKEDVRSETELEAGAQQVAAWRRQQLLKSGLSAQLASRLAGDGRYDLHALIELLERGCPPDLAIRIVAPLEEAAV